MTSDGCYVICAQEYNLNESPEAPARNLHIVVLAFANTTLMCVEP